MIEPGDRLVVVRGDAPYAGVVDVVGVERGRREREAHAERADEQLGGAHVHDRAHARRGACARGSGTAGATSRASRRQEARRARARAPSGGAARSHRRRARARSRSRRRRARTAKAGCASGPARRSSVAHRARDGPQDHLREAEDREDRHDVEQQHVLDHVHEEQLIGERVHGRDEREQRDQPASRAKQHSRHTGASRGGPRRRPARTAASARR